MFGSKEYYAKEKEEIRIKNNLKIIIETITGHPIEELNKRFYIEIYKEKYNKKPIKYIKENTNQRKKKTAEEIKKSRHNYYLKCKEKKEKILENTKRYRKTEKGKANSQRGLIKRRVRLKKIINTLTAKEWNEILKQYNFRCVYCNKKFSSVNKPTRDHIIPISKGGDNTKENVVPACKSCNSKKGVNTFYKRYEAELYKL